MQKARVRIAIIGGGFSGLAAAIELQRQGLNDFVVFEKSGNLGGTWYDNRYPGAEVDTPSHLYSYSYCGYDWVRTHALQGELLGYLNHVADKFDVRKCFQFKTEVLRVQWNDATELHSVHLGNGDVQEFNVVISALGFLNRPLVPAWAQAEVQDLTVVHSALWPKDLDLTGKRVGVVGTGSTAVQIVDEGSKVASALTVFQREPNWVVRKNNRAYTAQERGKFKSEFAQRISRWKAHIDYERGKFSGEQTLGSPKNVAMQKLCEERIATEFADRPDLKKLVTPNHPYLGKRPVISDHYYDALKRPNVTVAGAAAQVVDGGLVDAKGNKHELDILVLATGFQASSYLGALTVTGRDGQDLHEYWGEDPHAFLGLSVPNFPNFFIMYGPNTNTGPLVFMFEEQARYIAKSIQPIRNGTATSVEVKPGLNDRFQNWIQKRLSRTAWAVADNYFKSKSGKIVTQWPGDVTTYWLMCRLFRPFANVYKLSANAKRAEGEVSTVSEQKNAA